MSNESPMKIRTAEYPRFPTQRSSTWGKSGPNMSPAVMAGVVDGQSVDIPIQRKCRYHLGIDGAGVIESGVEHPGLSTKAVLTGKSIKTFN